MHKLFIAICSLSIILGCTQNKTESKIIETWEDGKPKKIEEYIIQKDGSKLLYKETMFFDKEQKFIEGTYNKKKERNGKWTSWFENGNKNSQGTYVDGKEHGKYTVWYPNGQIHYIGKYHHGQKSGKWKFYNEEGKLTKEVVY
ncbi:MAG: hypothetical protein WC142_04950 [Bacteroidales bacterium]|jgi:antitoxin component YwqK of YwqJK toxin-antitoxin module|nr:hypothetical protein [Bacteroidales bacterium]MDD2687408.1 hypothetical protein [Bacteroidales bacterium]MDD3330777.1 hypothetical protein [Bacteroidales bacterium]MDD3691373.1 hypothetical protein [Bacteroidales bacterium]MDD4045409.1 hypothetical protein [Bacteroidales bacterium]